METDQLLIKDCLPVLTSMNDLSVDAVITDPPYPNGSGLFLLRVGRGRDLRETIDLDLRVLHRRDGGVPRGLVSVDLILQLLQTRRRRLP